MPRVGVVDYGLGNLPSVTKALERVGATVALVSEPKGFEPKGFEDGLDAVVLPGVGHFGAGARNLSGLGLDAPIKEWAASGRPLLGICVGLQLFFEHSEEDPDARGLGIVDGCVRRLDPEGLKVPHMGWNTVEVSGPARVIDELGGDDMVYFVHSFYADPDEPAAAGTTTYGLPFCSALEQGNVTGVQFHPEKSADVGRRLLRRFCDLIA